MRLSRLTKLVVAVSMVAATAPAAAFAAPGSTPGTAPGARPDNPVAGGRTNAAERALEAVKAAFERDKGADAPSRPEAKDHRGAELTQQLLQLRLGFDELSPADQRTASAFLARPTDGNEYYYVANYGKRARPTHDCRRGVRTKGSKVCIHWARRTSAAPPPADRDGDGMPNQAEKTRDAMNLVWKRIVDTGGYLAPLPDRRGPDSKLDVYLADIGGVGLYGYCSSENVGAGRSAAAYCVLDNDYAKKQFPSKTPLGNLRITSAHEFFHAVQFAYDVREDAWLMESTATWIEDEIFDGVNDNRWYLTRSALTEPQRPLDTSTGSYFYGNWIWWRYLTERFPAQAGSGLPVLVRDVWQRAAHSDYDSGTYSMQALDQALAGQGQDLAILFAEFSSQNRLPKDPSTGLYEEGAAYPKAPLAARYNLDRSTKPQVGSKSLSLSHMSSATVAFVPQSGYGEGEWRLHLNVDLPGSAYEPVAQVTVFPVAGPVERTFINLDDKGVGTMAADFGSKTVRRVELTLTNGDHSYSCNQGTQWSCRGVPGQKRAYTFSASTSQPRL